MWIDLSKWTEPEPYVPKCLSVRLKTVVIRKSRGCIGELVAVKYVLKNALVLEKMTLQTNLDEKGRSELARKITSFA